jgi:hypothetical protein
MIEGLFAKPQPLHESFSGAVEATAPDLAFSQIKTNARSIS